MRLFRYLVPALVMAVVLWVVYRERNPAHAAPPVAQKNEAKAPISFAAQPPTGTRARCPVTGENFTTGPETVWANYGGRVYGFCCADCKPSFEKNPAQYADKK